MTRGSTLTFDGAEARTQRLSARLRSLTRFGVTTLVYMSAFLLVVLSPGLLDSWGFNYDSPGGAFYEKVHPGSWAAFGALGLAAVSAGNPINFLGRAARWKGLLFFLISWAMLLVFIIVFAKNPFTPIIDAFLLPMALFMVFALGAQQPTRRLALLIHALMFCNATLGIYEYLSGWRLTSFGLEPDDWRSSALFGHPLANAAMTGAYALALGVGGGRDLPAWLRPFLVILQLFSMVAFGGRTALVLTIFFLFLIFMRQAVGILRGRRIPLHVAAIFCFIAPFAIGALMIVAQAGFFNSLLERFVSDNGSAEARVIMLRVLGMFPMQQLLFGPDQYLLQSLQYQEGINYGIESFWVGFILQYGIVISMIFFCGLAGFCLDLVRATRPGTIVLLFYFFIVASSSVSLSVKSSVFGLLVIVIMVLLRGDGLPEAPARNSRRDRERLS